MDVVQLLLPIAIGLISGIAGAWLTLRIRFERFESQQQERERNRKEWRKATEKKLDKIEGRVNGMADHDVRLRYVEGHIAYVFDTIQSWKNDVLDRLREMRK